MAVTIILIFVFIALNAVLAASEISLVSISESRVSADAEAGNKKAKKVLYFMNNSTSFLSAIQIGITMFGFLNGAIASDAFSQKLVDLISKTNVSIHPDILRAVMTFVITIILTYFQVVFGELVPKRLSIRNPYKVAYATIGFIGAIAKVMRPLVWLLTASTNLILRMLGVNPHDEDNKITEEEIRLMLTSSEKKGVIDEDENEMIQNIFEFDSTVVSDIMTHRTEVSAVDVNISKDDLIEYIKNERYTRIPVYQDNIDDIIGIIHVKDAFRYFIKGESDEFNIKDILRDVHYVPESKNTSELFHEMKAKKIHIAIVIDEYGGTAGIVTIEDLIEEILGDIDDEYDVVETDITEVSKDEYIIDGLADIDQVEDILEAKLPVEDYDTLSGFILGQLGRFPEEDEKVSIEYGQYQFEILEYSDRVITTVKVTRLPDKIEENYDNSELSEY